MGIIESMTARLAGRSEMPLRFFPNDRFQRYITGLTLISLILVHVMHAQVPLGLDIELSEFVSSPPSDGMIKLGEKLFHDKNLSKTGDVSCADCHDPEHFFTDVRPTAVGIQGQFGNRNTPTILNTVLKDAFFWDGRAATLEEQALKPILNPIEMGNTKEGLLTYIQDSVAYRSEFQEVYGVKIPDLKVLAHAIASFERTLLTGNSRLDQYEWLGSKNALSDREVEGLRLFRGKAKCTTCHTGYNFTDHQYHNIGVGMDQPHIDTGRQSVTKESSDFGAFRTPSLRNVAKTGPYMHDGSFKTLEEVLQYYNKGAVKHPMLDEEIRPLNLTPYELKSLEAFLHTLTGDIVFLKAKDFHE